MTLNKITTDLGTNPDNGYDSPISSIEDILEDARNGRPYILVDAEDRENEGDVVIPAQMATPDIINFMARFARGLICLSITGERAKTLRLPPMVHDNGARNGTAFTVSIEAKDGISTGISPKDRAHTIAVAIDTTKDSAISCLPATFFRWWLVKAGCWSAPPYRSRCRYFAYGRALSGWRDLRDHQ